MAAPGKYRLKDYPHLVWAWSNMKKRCDNPIGKDACYSGISYTKAWDTFDGFCNDMLPTWQEGLTLDRIDPTRGYSKENCRWATLVEQANNKRNNHRVTRNGITRTLEEWIRLSDLKSSTVRQRIFGYGWSTERALTAPLRGGK